MPRSSTAPVAIGLLAALTARAAPPGGRVSALAWDEGLMGAAACRVCHERQYQDWLDTPHSRALDVLPEASQRDPRCTTCHATGDSVGLAGVQCESCHGPGADYWPDFVMRDPSLARHLGLSAAGSVDVCTRCHTEETPSLQGFDYRRDLPRIDHRRMAPGRS